MSNSYFDEIRPQLPHLLTRKDIKKYFGDIISPKYVANLDYQNQGPAKMYINRKAVYKTDEFIAWLEARMSDKFEF